MIDYIFWGLKAILFFIAIILLFKGLVGEAFILLVVPFFIAGVELITDQKKPWSYLLSGEAAQDDINTAIAGGLMLVSYLVMAGFLGGANLKARNG